MKKRVFKKASLAVGLALASSAVLASPVFYTFEGMTQNLCAEGRVDIGSIVGRCSLDLSGNLTSYLNKPVSFVLEIDAARAGTYTVGGINQLGYSPLGIYPPKPVYANYVGGSLPFESQDKYTLQDYGPGIGIQQVAKIEANVAEGSSGSVVLEVGSLVQVYGQLRNPSLYSISDILQVLLPGYAVNFIDRGLGVVNGAPWYGGVTGAATITSVSNSNPLVNANFANSSGAGSTASPFLPIAAPATDPGFRFVAPVFTGQTYSFDPVVATGYDYVVNSGPNIASVSLPDIGDGMFDVMWGWNGTSFTNISSLLAGDIFNFGGTGVDRFRVSGIETSAALDPANPLAFVTNLTFAGTGSVDLSQTPITTDVTGTVPEPASVFLFGAGVVGLVAARRRSQSRMTQQ